MYDRFLALDLRIYEIRKQIRQREHTLSVMASIDTQLYAAETSLFKLRDRSKHEQHDVAKLENMTLESLFYRLIGRHDQQLEKEAEEYLYAKMAVQTCELQIASLNSRLQELEGTLVKLANCDEEYEQLKQEQTELLAELGNPQSDRLQALSTDIALKSEQAKETAEAVDIGKKALNGIDSVIHLLKQVRTTENIGTLTYTFSGSSDPVGQAIEIALLTQPILDTFQLELTDISQQFWTKPDMKTPKKPDLMFFRMSRGLSGNRFSDITPQPKIWRWLLHLQQLQKKVATRLAILERQIEPLYSSLEHLDKERQELILELWQPETFQDSL